MNIKSFITLMLSCAAPFCALAAEPVAAFPSRPITLLVPTGAGGSMDGMARAVAEEAGRLLGHPMIVDNKPGAGNTMAAIAMVSAEPNGYTLGLVSCATVKLPLVTKAQYDPMKDLTYIARVAEFALVAAVRADKPYRKMADLVAESKTTGLFYGTAGRYNSPHLATLRLASATGAHWTNIPYKSDTDAITALIAGDIQFIASSNSVLPFIQSGKLRGLGVFGDKRFKGGLEAVPTMKEQGFDVVETCPFGIMGPKGMDPALVSKLEAAIKRAVDTPTFRNAADRFGMEPDYLDARGFDRWAHDSFAKDQQFFQKLGKNPE